MSGQRKKGNYGQVSMPLNSGQVYSNVALTPSSSKTIMGTAYTDRFCGHTATHWNCKATASTPIGTRLTGIVGAATVTPHASADKCQVATGFSLYADNGSAVTVAADTDISLTRPATDVGKWNAIVVSSAGAITAVAGTDSATTDVLETWGTGAGQIPFTPVGSFCIGLVKFVTSAAAVITSGMIYYTLPTAGTLIQERSDIPDYDRFSMEGGILLKEALIKNHTGGLARVAYASFMSQKDCLGVHGHTKSWSLNWSRPIGKMPAQGDVMSPKDFADAGDATGSLVRYMVDSLFAKAAVYEGYGYVKLWPDKNVTAEYWEAAVLIPSFDTNSALGEDMIDNLSFEVNGTLEWREA